MAKPKPRPKRAVDAVSISLSREAAKRPDGLKPIEIIKVAICAYQDYIRAETPEPSPVFESADRIGLRRGTQAAIDRMLFNANYWLAAYEDQIVKECGPVDPAPLLKALTVWSTHTLKLNTLSNEEAIGTFERFCPPFAINNRRGSSTSKGKGPIPEFDAQIHKIAEQHPKCVNALMSISERMKGEAASYEALPAASALDALFSILPVWCLQDKIGLVSGSWWEDADVMMLLADALKDRFIELGYEDAICQYFRDSLYEAIDAYQRDISAIQAPISTLPVPELLQIVRTAREANPGFETDGYGSVLPTWLVAKEQLVWNTLVCALYGPRVARPLMTASPELCSPQSRPASKVTSDAIAGAVKASLGRRGGNRESDGEEPDYDTLANQALGFRNLSIEHIMSIPSKLEMLGYTIVPDGGCNPDQRVIALSPSEVECLAVLEHRRWIAERIKAGWVYGEEGNDNPHTSPYLVPWEDLPERVQEWNRSAIRNIPTLLAAENLAIARRWK